MKLDQVFENKDEIADDVKKNLQERMVQCGWEIVRALVNDIEPDAKIKDAMNEVNHLSDPLSSIVTVTPSRTSGWDI
jgi:regulator of protease activity HflC (stomatin/prohibitin superfamily)